MLVVLGIVLLVCITNPVVFAWAAPVVIAFFFLRRYYIKTAREVKRIEGLSKYNFKHLFLSSKKTFYFLTNRQVNDFSDRCSLKIGHVVISLLWL